MNNRRDEQVGTSEGIVSRRAVEQGAALGDSGAQEVKSNRGKNGDHIVPGPVPSDQRDLEKKQKKTSDVDCTHTHRNYLFFVNTKMVDNNDEAL